MGTVGRGMLDAFRMRVLGKDSGVIGTDDSGEEKLPMIAKNTILRDRISDQKTKLAKQGPLMVRNPKKQQKGA